MLYYKVPIIDGHTDCSAGSILCCAYPQDNYMVCKFESVAKVGSGWVEITADEFEENWVPPRDGIDEDIRMDMSAWYEGEFTVTKDDGDSMTGYVTFENGRPKTVTLNGHTLTLTLPEVE